MALRKDGPNITPHDDKVKWQPGKVYKCILSASTGYREGELYDCYQNAKGYKCLRDRSGVEDLCSMLVSAFVEYEMVDRRGLTVINGKGER